MSSIFGIFHRDDRPVVPSALETMRQSMADWGRDGGGLWWEGPAGLGQALFFNTPEARYERLPRLDADGGIVLTAAARVDNREELIRDLRLEIDDWNARDQQSLRSALDKSPTSNCQSSIPDGELVLRAYRRWGEDCVTRIYGDWAFAVWHPAERRLFLARDHLGNTALYYYADPRVFAFASSRQALLALNPAPSKMDELYLAQVLISWPAYHGERTIHTPLRRLPPAHCLTVTRDRLDMRQYWRLEDTPIRRLPRRQDYVDAFREVFDEAVRARLRAPLPQEEKLDGRIAVSLSGGLDSGSVTVTAARFLHEEGQSLTAFTSVPLSGTGTYAESRLGDERVFAQATAQFAGNVDLCPVTAATITPIQAIRHMLQVHNEPAHAAGNFYWMIEIRQAARARGCRVLLNGQMGNASISWTGDVFSQPFAFQLHQMGWRRWAREQIKRAVPSALLTRIQRRRMAQQEWNRGTAIHPDFASRLNLLEQRLNDPNEWPRTPREQRCKLLMPGRSFSGALHAQMGAAYGLDVRDPTADPRVLAFTFSVPDAIFIDPEAGVNRWLIREAMRDRLPDEVRLNRRLGLQAADLVPRLRACAVEVETALDELACGPAAAYLDVLYMRQVWQMIQTQNTPEAFRKAVTILTRGIMAGLFVNQFADGR